MTSGGDWSPEEGWRQLELSVTPPMRGEFRVLDTQLPVGPSTVLLAVDASGLRHVFVPVGEDFEPVHDRRSGGVHLTTRQLLDGADQRRFLDLSCQKLHLNSVFSHLAREILDGLRVDPLSPFQTCRTALQRWRELLDRETSHVLSTEALCGLFGELWHLAGIAGLNPNGVATWQGPHGARHDFSSEGLALEVKTTLRRGEWKLRIHGLHQLDYAEGTRLYLSAMQLELNGAVGDTVPSLVQRILLTGADRRELLGRLSLTGYDLRDEAHYHQFRFGVVEQRTYEVSASFPRLVESTFGTAGVPAGILEVDYTLDLVASGAQSLPPNALEGVHAVLAGGHDAAGTTPPPV